MGGVDDDGNDKDDDDTSGRRGGGGEEGDLIRCLGKDPKNEHRIVSMWARRDGRAAREVKGWLRYLKQKKEYLKTNNMSS